MRLRRLIRLFFILILVYLLLGVLVFFAQRSILYFPTVRTRQRIDDQARRANLQRWTNSSGEFMRLKRLSPKQPAQGTVLITYGNGSSAVGCAYYATCIQRVAAFDVFILEYPGYQDRAGRPSQTSLFNAADEAFRSLPTNAPIYLVGESLGSGVASYLAGAYPNRIAGLVFISPFNNLTDVAQSHIVVFPVKWMLLDRFASDEYLRHYHGKLAVAVDGRDFTVPERFGRRLYNGYSGPKKIWEFPNGGHIDIEHPETFWKEVIEFWQSLTPSPLTVQ